MEKICTKCNIPKKLEEFYPEKQGKFGTRHICIICEKEKNRQNYLKNKEERIKKQKLYYKNNTTKVIEYQKEYSSLNKEIIAKRHSEYFQENFDKLSSRSKQYNQENKESINNWRKNRRKEDPLFKLSCNIRSKVSRCFKQKGFKKSHTNINLLGIDFKYAKEHLENQFLPVFNWENYGIIWEIDHKTPLASAKTEQEVIELFNYKNLQPMFKTTAIAKEYGYVDKIGNRNKSNKI